MSAKLHVNAYRCMSHKNGPSIDVRATFITRLSMYEPHFPGSLSMYEPPFHQVAVPKLSNPSSRKVKKYSKYRCTSHILQGQDIDVPAIFSSPIVVNEPQLLDVRTTENQRSFDARATKTRLMSHKFICNVLKSERILQAKQVTLCLYKNNKTTPVLLLKGVE